MFDLKLLPKIEMIQRTTDRGRYYEIENGNKYKSVTSILAQYGNKEWLEAWKEKVGEERSVEIANFAKAKGTSFHKLAETFLLNEPIENLRISPFVKKDFNSVRPHLEKNITDIFGIELPLYSDKLRTAGTTDLVCSWKNKYSIVDFKTAKFPRDEKSILDYFVQSTVYSIMVMERYKIFIPNIVIIMSVAYDEPLIFEKNINEFLPEVKRIFILERNLT